MEIPTSRPTARRRRALIVDEAAAMPRPVRDALASEFDCQEICCTEEGIAAARSHPPKVLIYRGRLPGTELELSRRIRAEERLREIPLVVICADADAARRAQALVHGADECLSEPVEASELLARILALIRFADAREEVLRQNRELDRAHRELLHAQRQLLEAERLATTGALISGLAHAINNPLAVVWAGVEEMSHWVRGEGEAKGPADAELGVVLCDVRSNLERIRDILQRLTLLHGPGDNEHASINVHAEIDRAVAIAHFRLGRVELKRRCEGPPTIEAPPGYLAQIVAPVLLNAAEAVASTPQPRIEIRTRRLERGLEIVIEDNGSAHDGVPRVLDPFFAGGPEGTPLLGLGVCQRLIERLGGSAQLISQAGRGTQFRICLPLAAEGRRPSPSSGSGAPHRSAAPLSSA